MKGDWSLVSFTVLGQAAVGASWGLAASWALLAARADREIAGTATAWGLATVPVLAALAIGVSLFHLGRPVRAWRAVANLRLSWLSREILAAGVFFVASAAVVLVPGPGRAPFLALAGAAGAVLVVAMARTYRMRTVPAWDSWTTGAFFLQSALASGGTVTALVLALRSPHEEAGLAQVCATAVGALALVAGPLLFSRWRRTLARHDGAAHETADRLARDGARVRARWVGTVIAAALLLAAPALAAPWRVAALAAAVTLAFTAELLGRVLFYRARVRTGL